ncbi:MAG: sortase [Anaerolineae bacterium]|nr:sortase [Anaerolineae bacterium]
MKASQGEKQFRRLAIGAGITVWVGLTLLAVGVVFSVGGSAARANALRAQGPGGSTMRSLPATTAVALSPTRATLTPTATATATAPMLSLEESQPTATATATPEPTATFTPEPAPPTRLVIPAINVDTPVQEVGWHEEVVEGTLLAVWDVADYAASWHYTSAKPGEPDNMVMTGHHNIAGEVFRELVTLQVGDLVYVYSGDREFTYQVSEVLILPEKGMPLSVRRENGRWIAPTGQEMLTLVTCWPYNNNTHRVIVRALPVG